jgi:hypothetical protein
MSYIHAIRPIRRIVAFFDQATPLDPIVFVLVLRKMTMAPIRDDREHASSRRELAQVASRNRCFRFH